MLHKIDKCIGVMSMVTKEDWVVVCQNVKNQCTYAIKGLTLELDIRFLAQEFMNATNNVYPQYWVQLKATLMFLGHLQIFKSHYCCQRLTKPDAKSHAGLLNHVLLEQQSNFFMTTMQFNNEIAIKPPYDQNPTIQMWKRFTSNVILKDRIFEYFKLVEPTIVVFLVSVEDKHIFFIVTFMKSKLWN